MRGVWKVEDVLLRLIAPYCALLREDRMDAWGMGVWKGEEGWGRPLRRYCGLLRLIARGYEWERGCLIAPYRASLRQAVRQTGRKGAALRAGRRPRRAAVRRPAAVAALRACAAPHCRTACLKAGMMHKHTC